MTLVFSTSHEVRPQVAAFTKQRDNTKRSQRLRCYRRRHEYSKTRGSRVSGRRSSGPRREWSGRHFMNRKPSLIDLALAASGERSPEPALPPRCSAGPRRRKWRSRRTWRRAGSAQLTYRDVSAGCLLAANETHGPACADSGIRKSARDHRLTNKLFAPLSKNIRLRRKAVGGRGASRRGIAHTNCFPAAGRLMRAGRAGAGGGSGARAHRLPSRSARARAGRSERDRDTSLSQCRLVNTNRPRSRDKIFDLHFMRTHTRERRRRHTHAWASRIARQRRRTARCATFDNFSRKLTCSAAVDEARRRHVALHERYYRLLPLQLLKKPKMIPSHVYYVSSQKSISPV